MTARDQVQQCWHGLKRTAKFRARARIQKSKVYPNLTTLQGKLMHSSLDWSAIGSWLSFGATLFVGAFVYGRLTEKVSGHEHRIEKLEDAKDDHSQRIAKLEAKRNESHD
jgi:hypothetical protein